MLDFLFFVSSTIVFLLGISTIVFFHELGHYLSARLFGVKVPIFSVGFGKKLYKVNWWGTEFSFSLIPLGGYVEIDQESPNSDFVKLNIVKKLFILFSGVLVNLMLALFLGWIFLLNKNSIILPHLYDYPFSANLSIKGNLVSGVSLDPRNYSKLDYENLNFLFSSRTYLLIKNNEEYTTNLYRFFNLDDMSYTDYSINSNSFQNPYLKVLSNPSNKNIPIKKDDYIVGLNGQDISSLKDFNARINELQGKAISLSILRNFDKLDVTFDLPLRNQQGGVLSVMLTEVNGDGLNLSSDVIFLEYGKGLDSTFNLIKDLLGYQLSVLLDLFRKSVILNSVEPLAENLGSLPSVINQTNLIVKSGDLSNLFLLFTLLNISLFIFNLLPIPALDGGQILIESLGWIFSKTFKININKNLKNFLNLFSFILLMALGFLVILKDLVRLDIFILLGKFLEGLFVNF